MRWGSIVTLCGPTKFYKTFDKVALELSKASWAYFSIGSHRGADSSLNPDVHGFRPVFEQLHKDKILVSKAIIVINVDGYYGDNTADEIWYAREHNVKVYWYDLTSNFNWGKAQPRAEEELWTELLK